MAERLGISGAIKNLFTEASGRPDADAISKALGGGLLLAAGAELLDLYLTGYRSVAGVGTLFLAQSSAALAVGAGLVSLFFARSASGRRAAGSFSWQQVVSAAGALLALGLLCVYVAALGVGVFGHKQAPTVAGIVAAAFEVVAFLVLGRLACSGLRPGIPAGPIGLVLASAALSLMLVADAVAVLPASAASRRPALHAKTNAVVTNRLESYSTKLPVVTTLHRGYGHATDPRPVQKTRSVRPVETETSTKASAVKSTHHSSKGEVSKPQAAARKTAVASKPAAAAPKSCVAASQPTGRHLA
jgi:hypothetical protein